MRSRLEELERTQSPIRVGMVSAGQMGRGFVAQVEDIPGMEVVAKRDLTAGDGLGGIGSADYYGWLRAASEAAGMLPLGWRWEPGSRGRSPAGRTYRGRRSGNLDGKNQLGA